MKRWNRTRAMPPVPARLTSILERLGVSVGAGMQTTNHLLGRLDTAVKEVMMSRLESRRTLEVYRAAIEAAPVALVVTDHTGIEIARSRVATTLLSGGASATLSDLSLQDLMIKAAAVGETQHDIIESFGPPRRTLSLVAVPLSATKTETETRPVLALIEDTTEWRRAELARRDLVTNISHELRTPVGAVALLAETIAGEDDPDTIRRLAGRLEIEATRLTSTLQDVMALSRLEAVGTSERQFVDFSDLVGFCTARFRHNAESVGMTIVVDNVEPDLNVHADRSLLTTAIDNLLDNAVKYSDKGKPIHVALHKTMRATGSFAELSVQDSGIGIPMRERQRIFERFYRVDRARSRDTGGSGLGLAIVRHVAVSHDGQVEVDSLEGVGSTFTFRIPLLDAMPGTAGSEAHSATV